MQDELLLVMLKQDLEILHSKNEDYLIQLIGVAKEMISREGILLGDSYEDQALVTMYAAYLYRQRARPDGDMPKMLRRGLNNRLFAEKAKVTDDV